MWAVISQIHSFRPRLKHLLFIWFDMEASGKTKVASSFYELRVGFGEIELRFIFFNAYRVMIGHLIVPDRSNSFRIWDLRIHIFVHLTWCTGKLVSYLHLFFINFRIPLLDALFLEPMANIPQGKDDPREGQWQFKLVKCCFDLWQPFLKIFLIKF